MERPVYGARRRRDDDEQHRFATIQQQLENRAFLENYGRLSKYSRVPREDEIREAPDPYTRWASGGDHVTHDTIASERFAGEIHDEVWADRNRRSKRNLDAAREHHAATVRDYESGLMERKLFAGEPELPVVVGSEAIQAACDDGEPVEIKGTVSLPARNYVPVDDLLFQDASWVSQAFNGEYDQRFNDITIMIEQGFGASARQGTKILLKGFEFRFRLVNTKEKFQMQNTYGWAGNAGLGGTTRNVPAITIPAGNLVEYEDSNGAWANSHTNYDAVNNWTNSTPVPFFSVGAIGPFAVCGSGGLPITETNLARAIAPAAITLQPEQIDIVDQPAMPPMPSWQSPAIFSANGPEAGNMCPVRIMILYDKYGQDTPYVLPGPEPSWFDIMAAPLFDSSPVHGLYNPRSLDRFVVLYDSVWEPATTNYEMTAVCPPKEICLETVYNSGPLGLCSSGAIFFGVCASEQVRIVPPSPMYYTYTGTFRLFYTDH